MDIDTGEYQKLQRKAMRMAESPSTTNWLLTLGGGLTILLMAFLANEIWRTSKAVERIESQMAHVSELQKARENIFRLEMNQSLAEAKLVTSEARAKVEAHENNFRQIWPRLRALDKNLERLNDAMGDRRIPLADPQQF